MALRTIKRHRFNEPDGTHHELMPGDVIPKEHAEHPFYARDMADGCVEDLDKVAAADKAAAAEAAKKAAAEKEAAAAEKAAAQAAAEAAAKADKK